MKLRRALVLLTYNEIEALPRLFDRIPRGCADHVFAVDGGSQDGTVDFLKSKGLPVLGQPRRGRGCAFMVALNAAQADVICFYSPDGNEDPEDIPKLFDAIERSGADMVVASRMSRGAHNEEDEKVLKLRKWVNLAFTFLANVVWNRGPYLTDTINGFRVVRADSMRRCALDADGFVIEYLMSMRMMKLNFRLGEIATYEYPRLGGQSTAHSWPTGLEFTRHLIREMFSAPPDVSRDKDFPCPLCSAAGVKKFVRSYGAYNLYDCGACSIGFCEPFKNPGPEYYEHKPEIYSASLETTTDPTSFEYDEALALLSRELPSGARVLDVGCGAGGLLHRIRGAGFAAAGVDFNSERVAALRAAGFEIFEGGVVEYGKKNTAPFDAITMMEIIEHLDNPAQWLAAIRGLLKPGGLLIVGTPNRARTLEPFVAEMEQVDSPPHHLTRWSQEALSRFLATNGFRVAQCRPLGVPRAQLQLIARNFFRFGMAAKTLAAARTAESAQTPAPAPAAARFLRMLVAVKSAAIDAAVVVIYPLFSAAYRVFGWQGVILFAAARCDSEILNVK